MAEIDMSDAKRGIRPGAAALVAAIGMIGMAVIAPAAIFGVIENLTVSAEPAATAANLVESSGRFRLAAAGLVVVAVLDVLVAWGLYEVLRHENRSLSLLGAWFRIAYAAIFAAAVNDLFGAVGAASSEPAQAAFLIESFDSGWQMGLFLFAIHLEIVGWLLWRAEFVSRLFGALLMIAGVGYAVDAAGTLIDPTYALNLAMYTFVGEVVFIFWLLIRGRKLEAPEAGSQTLTRSAENAD